MSALKEVLEKIKSCANQCQRDASTIQLVVASKYFTVEQILDLYKHGQRDFGENKVQDALHKMEKLPKDIRWHFIGHLQKNKVNKIVDSFELIHSIDSLELAEKIDQKSQKKQKILLQVNTSGEESKTGFDIHLFYEELKKIQQLGQLEVVGLMTMAPETDNKVLIQETFSKLRQIREKLNKPDWLLSMGMSQDYPIAIAQGANLIRLGRILL